MSNDLIIRHMQPTDEDLKLFRGLWIEEGSLKTLNHVRWQYLANPSKVLFVDFAIDPGVNKLAAVYAVLPVHFWVKGQVRLACQSLDTRTGVNYRGRGLFIKLAKMVYERCEKEGIAFVYGFPNRNSVHGFYNRLNWHSLDPIPQLIKPLKLTYLLRKLISRGPSIQENPVIATPLEIKQPIVLLQEFDDQVDDLWKEFAQQVGVAINRTKEYLNWRFRDRPDSHYITLGYYNGNRLEGLVIYRIMEKHGGKVGYVMELLFRPEKIETGKVLLDCAIKHFRQENCDAALCMSLENSPTYSVFRRAGFVHIPSWLRPIELHFGVRPLALKDEALLFNRDFWFLSYADSDTV